MRRQRKKEQTTIHKGKALPRKELKGSKTQAGLQWRAPKAKEGKGGRGEGREQVQASAQQCLCQEPAFLKLWAGGPALQAEGSPGSGAGKHRGEPSACRVRCHAALGRRQREGGQSLREGLARLVCVSVFRKHTSLQAACSALCFPTLCRGAAPLGSIRKNPALLAAPGGAVIPLERCWGLAENPAEHWDWEGWDLVWGMERGPSEERDRSDSSWYRGVVGLDSCEELIPSDWRTVEVFYGPPHRFSSLPEHAFAKGRV